MHYEEYKSGDWQNLSRTVKEELTMQEGFAETDTVVDLPRPDILRYIGTAGGRGGWRLFKA